jgi:hypothetical protein
VSPRDAPTREFQDFFTNLKVPRGENAATHVALTDEYVTPHLLFSFLDSIEMGPGHHGPVARSIGRCRAAR